MAVVLIEAMKDGDVCSRRNRVSISIKAEAGAMLSSCSVLKPAAIG